jgi:hypothetical protein
MRCKTHAIEMHGIIQCHNTTNTYKNLLLTHLKFEETHLDLLEPVGTHWNMLGHVGTH